MPDGTLPARTEFTKRQKAMIFERANGCCEKCGRKVGGAIAYDVDHIIPATFGGRATLDNGQILCKQPCHVVKTKRDNREAKKSNRIRKKNNPETRPAPKMRSGPSNWPQGRKIQSRNDLRKRAKTSPEEQAGVRALYEKTPLEEAADA